MDFKVSDLYYNCDLEWRSRSSKLKSKWRFIDLNHIYYFKEICWYMSEHKPMLLSGFFFKQNNISRFLSLNNDQTTSNKYEGHLTNKFQHKTKFHPNWLKTLWAKVLAFLHSCDLDWRSRSLRLKSKCISPLYLTSYLVWTKSVHTCSNACQCFCGGFFWGGGGSSQLKSSYFLCFTKSHSKAP